MKQHVRKYQEANQKKLCTHVQGLVSGVFIVAPPQLDLDYLEIGPPVLMKKGGDIFDDVRHYRKFR